MGMYVTLGGIEPSTEGEYSCKLSVGINGMRIDVITLIGLTHHSGGIMDLDHYLEKMNTRTSFI